MKRNMVILTLFLIIALQTKAQEYIPMVKENSVYNTTSVIIALEPWDVDTYSTISLCIFGDTVINTVNYKKVYELDCVRDNVVLDPERYKGAIREDIVLQQVWFYRNDQEFLLYDFSLNVDDIFVYHSEFCGGDVQLQVTNIGTIEINGIERRKFDLNPIDISGWAESWIEGIGSTVHLYDYTYLHGNFGVYLSCYFENEELIYSPWGECCEGETNTESILTKTFTMSPNPATDEISFQFADDLTRMIIIYSADNKTVDKFEINSSFYSHNLDNLKKGIYFIKILEGKTSYTRKMVII